MWWVTRRAIRLNGRTYRTGLWCSRLAQKRHLRLQSRWGRCLSWLHQEVVSSLKEHRLSLRSHQKMSVPGSHLFAKITAWLMTTARVPTSVTNLSLRDVPRFFRCRWVTSSMDINSIAFADILKLSQASLTLGSLSNVTPRLCANRFRTSATFSRLSRADLPISPRRNATSVFAFSVPSAPDGLNNPSARPLFRKCSSISVFERQVKKTGRCYYADHFRWAFECLR